MDLCAIYLRGMGWTVLIMPDETRTSIVLEKKVVVGCCSTFDKEYSERCVV